MSIESVTMYRLVCDWPGCKVSAQDESDYYAWREVSSCIDDANGAGWHEDARQDGDTFYCDAHPAVWASDREDGKPLPQPPYLLIHDGDDPELEDGTVTLVEVAS